MDKDRLTESIKTFLANPPYQRLFLFVHPEIPWLTTAVDTIQQTYPWPTIPLSYTLAQTLPDIPANKWAYHAPRQLKNILSTHQPGPLLCTDIDLLFEPKLKLDPLSLLRQASTSTTLIIAWPGTYTSQTLTYAVPEHNHARIWSEPELCTYCGHQLTD